MSQFLVAIHHPDDYNPAAVEDEVMMEGIHALNREMIAAGVRVLACGLRPVASARTLQAQADGTVLVTEGPYLAGKEHVAGFWILETADLDAAVEWGKKGAVACQAAVEVREMLFRPKT